MPIAADRRLGVRAAVHDRVLPAPTRSAISGGSKAMRRFWRWTCVVILAVLPGTAWGQGIMLSSFGPVNASMGGASTAAPIEALSALGWNPATISGLPSSELSVGLGLLLSDSGHRFIDSRPGGRLDGC